MDLSISFGRHLPFLNEQVVASSESIVVEVDNDEERDEDDDERHRQRRDDRDDVGPNMLEGQRAFIGPAKRHVGVVDAERRVGQDLAELLLADGSLQAPVHLRVAVEL